MIGETISLHPGESVYSGAFAVAWNVFVGLWTFGAVTGGGILFALFSLPFWAAGFMLGKCVILTFISTGST